MGDYPGRALHQSFLPTGAVDRAFVWKYSQAIGGRRPRHFHGEPELNLVVRGSAVYGVGRRVVRVSQGELVTFLPGQDHALIEASPDLYLYAVGLDSMYSAEALRGLGSAVIPMHVKLPKGELPGVLDRSASILERNGVDSAAAELWERVHWLGLRGARGAGHAAHVLTRRALQILTGAPELSLTVLARELRTQPSEVSRHFHREVGVTLVRYRTRLRLLALMRLVGSGDRDLIRLASAAGFGSYSQCHRAFQSELGCAPREYFSEVGKQMQLAYCP